MSLLRKNIANLTPYQPGKPIQELKRQLKLKDIIKLASNENPLGASPKAKQAMLKELDSVNRYPEGGCFYLRQALARKLKLKPEMFVFGNGSDELIDILIKAFVGEGENIVTSGNTFLEYEILAKVLGRKTIKAPLRDFAYDLKALLNKVNKKTKLIFIANPNNPTGTYVKKAEFEAFLKRVPKTAIVVLDEAYDVFIDVKDFPFGLDYVKRDNVITLKTFSKSYGLAGLRIGYAVGNPKLIAGLEKARPPFNVNLLAQAGATAALKDRLFIKKTRKTVLDGKAYLYRQFERLGLFFVPTVANFILFDAGRNAKKIYETMLKSGVIIRDMRQYGLDNFIRVTIGTPAENRRFIRVLEKILTKRGRK